MSTKNIANLVYELRTDRGWTQKELAQRLGLPQSAISARETGTFKQWGKGERRKMAEAFGMTVDQFDEMWRDSSVAVRPHERGIPVINNAPAGVTRDFTEWGTDSGEGMEYIDRGTFNDDETLFAVKIVGASMSPTISDGDYVIFRPVDRYRASVQVPDGSVCFVRLDSEHEHGCMVARLSVLADKRILLAKDNPDFRSMVIDRKHVEQVAIAVEARTRRGLKPAHHA